MKIGETLSLGRFTVRCALRFDNPAWPKYLIFHGETLIGSQLSCPNMADCEWHEARRGRYATEGESKKDSSWQLRISMRRGRTRKVDSERELQEAIAG